MKLIITEGQFRKHIRESVLSEEGLFEAAKRMESLPKDVCLFQKKDGRTMRMSLYSPSEDKIYGMVTVSPIRSGNYTIEWIEAIRGYGVFLYELAMMYAAGKGKGLMPDREGIVSDEAWFVWKFFYNKREDVNKEPAQRRDISNEFDPEDHEGDPRSNLQIYNTVYSFPKNQTYEQLVKCGWDNKQYLDAALHGTVAVNESVLAEGDLFEAAKRMESLPKDICLYRGESGDSVHLALYSPSEERKYAEVEIKKTQGGNYQIKWVTAKQDFGAFIYELGMMYAATKGAGVMPDRSGLVSEDAFYVWVIFYHKRDDVRKEPADREDYSGAFDPDDFSGDDNEEKMRIYNSVYYLPKTPVYDKLIQRGLQNPEYLEDAILGNVDHAQG